MVERRREVMKYQFSYNPVNKIVKVEFYHNLEDEDVEAFAKDMHKTLKGRDAIGAILDHGTLLDRRMPNLTRKGRKAFGEVARESGIKKFAMVAVPAIVKTISQTIGFLAKGIDAETRFFKTEEEALSWLKGDAK
ncbi:STAS/SEC14 domain-containing protein [candidate division WOR-3 bacterium]|nr:STAS/SEC14 domain-containing protein [candidate division WOR-3 bacterium]